MRPDRRCLLDDKQKGKTRSPAPESLFSACIIGVYVSVVAMYLCILVSMHPSKHRTICRSCAAKRNPLSAKLIIGKSLPAQLPALHMCKIKQNFSFAQKNKKKKEENCIFFSKFRVLSDIRGWIFERRRVPLPIPATHKVLRQICIAPKNQKPKNKKREKVRKIDPQKKKTKQN